MGEQKKPEDFNLLDHATASDPYEFYRVLHEQQPVYRMPQTGIYILTKYDDVRDPERFSSVVERGKVMQKTENFETFMGILRARGWEHVPTLQRTDPPLHNRTRGIVDRVLGPRHARALTPQLREHAARLIDAIIEKAKAGETCEFLADFAVPFPGIIVAEQIGLPSSEYRTFKRWAENLHAPFNPNLTQEQITKVAETELEMQHYLADMIEQRRAAPKADLISELVQGIEGEEPLSMHELQNVLHQLISGGYDTVTTALGHMMWQFVRFPELVAELRADPSKIKNYIEECLRWESPVQGLFRITKVDVEIGGVTIPAGSICIMRYAAANRDESHFACPAKLDIARPNATSHLAFGAGAHFCPGAVLARTELTVAAEALLDRLEGFALAKPLPEPVHNFALNFMPLRELHITVTPRT